MQDSVFSNELRSNETILWTSKVKEFKTWDKITRKCTIFLLGIALILTVGLGLLVKLPSVTAFTAIISLFPFLIFVIHTLADNKKVKAYQYALTDERAMVYNGDYHSKDYKDINNARMIFDADMLPSIYFGMDDNIDDESMLKALSVHALKPGKSQLGNDFVFYAIDDFEEALNTIKKYVHVKETLHYTHYHE